MSTDREQLEALTGLVLVIHWIGIPLAMGGFFGWPTGVLTLVVLSLGILYAGARETKRRERIDEDA